MEATSTPEQIAEVVYEAETDGKDQLRYVAGADAQAAYASVWKLVVKHREKKLGICFWGEFDFEKIILLLSNVFYCVCCREEECSWRGLG